MILILNILINFILIKTEIATMIPSLIKIVLSSKSKGGCSRKVIQHKAVMLSKVFGLNVMQSTEENL